MYTIQERVLLQISNSVAGILNSYRKDVDLVGTIKIDAATYKDLLKHYMETQDEKSLYGAEQITKSFIKNNFLPEEIVNLHIQALAELYPNIYEEMQHSMNFLLETMISYGLAHQEFESLRERQSELKSEI